MDMTVLSQFMLAVMTGDDSKPWLIAVCLIISLIIMIFLFVLGKNDDDKGGKGDQSSRHE